LDLVYIGSAKGDLRSTILGHHYNELAAMCSFVDSRITAGEVHCPPWIDNASLQHLRDQIENARSAQPHRRHIFNRFDEHFFPLNDNTFYRPWSSPHSKLYMGALERRSRCSRASQVPAVRYQANLRIGSNIHSQDNTLAFMQSGC
jgi:hypothetical protein